MLQVMRRDGMTDFCKDYSGLPIALSTAGEGLSTNFSTLPISPLVAATSNMVPQVAGTR